MPFMQQLYTKNDLPVLQQNLVNFYLELSSRSKLFLFRPKIQPIKYQVKYIMERLK